MSKEWESPNLLDVRRAVEDAVEGIESLEPKGEDEDANQSGTRVRAAELVDYWGMRAAIRKRLAEVQFLLYDPDWERTLRLMLEDYRRGLAQPLQDHWISGQFVVIRSVLRLPARPEEGQKYEFWWEQACHAALAGLRNQNWVDRMWAHSTLSDLFMVALAEEWEVPSKGRVSAENVLAELKSMIEVGGGVRACPALWPTFRQFWRWRYWWTTQPGWSSAAEFAYDFLADRVGVHPSQTPSS